MNWNKTLIILFILNNIFFINASIGPIPFTALDNATDNIESKRCDSKVNGCNSCRSSSSDLVCSTNLFTCNKCVNNNNTATKCNDFTNRTKDIIRTVYIPRSIGSNTARRLCGWQQFIHRFGICKNYLTTGHILGYSHSFKGRNIAQELFGRKILIFEGSQIIDRSACSLIADNFGLSPFFKGRLEVNPTIESVFFDNQFYIGLNNWCNGLYLKIESPIVYTKWDLSICTKNQTTDCPGFPRGAQARNEVEGTCSLIKALSGDFVFGDMKEQWSFGKITCGKKTKFGLADINLSLGYDFYKCPDAHAGIYAQLVIPTGNKPKSHFLFEPIIGNSKHFELGLGVSGHLIVWQNCYDHCVSLWLDGYVTHCFANTQCRTFDFCKNGPLSRYLLLKELVHTDSGFQYTGNLINGVNFTTRKSLVNINVKGDVSAKIAYRSPCYTVDIGYNFYGQSTESICIKENSNCNLAIKGAEGTYAPLYNIPNSMPLSFGSLEAITPLNVTNSHSTISLTAPRDNQVPLQLTTNSIAVTAYSRQSGPINGNGVIIAQDSNPPVLLKTKDLNIRSGSARAQATHKIFGYFAYNFINCQNIIPYLGFGAEFEVEALACNNRRSLNQWSAWLKGGLAF